MNVVKELIQSGVDVDEQDQFGSTALTVSAAYNDKRIIKLLLKKGRPFTAPESNGLINDHICINPLNFEELDIGHLRANQQKVFLTC